MVELLVIPTLGVIEGRNSNMRLSFSGLIHFYGLISSLGFQIGCGHGLPGILACLEVKYVFCQSTVVQDCWCENVSLCQVPHLLHQGAAAVHFQDFNAEVLQCLTIPNVKANLSEKSPSLNTNAAEVRFFAGDWSEIHQLLPHACDNEKDQTCLTGQSTAGYDIILMAETVYSVPALPTLYELIKKVPS